MFGGANLPFLPPDKESRKSCSRFISQLVPDPPRSTGSQAGGGIVWVSLQPDTICQERQAALEGEEWKRKQLADRFCPFGFFAYLAAWEVMQQYPEEEFTPAEVLRLDLVPGVSGGDGAIYGAGGWARYSVRADGLIVLDYSSTHSQKVARAKLLGF